MGRYEAMFPLVYDDYHAFVRCRSIEITAKLLAMVHICVVVATVGAGMILLTAMFRLVLWCTLPPKFVYK
jgi:hypothetical protein